MFGWGAVDWVWMWRLGGGVIYWYAAVFREALLYRLSCLDLEHFLFPPMRTVDFLGGILLQSNSNVHI